jgi:hypothetical protein
LPADHATAPSGCSATLSIQRRFGVGRQHADLALGVERNDLAVIAAGDDARAVGCRAQHAPPWIGDGEISPSAPRSRIFLGADEDARLAEKMHRGDRHADRKRPHLVVIEAMEGPSPGSNSFITW